MDIYQFEDYKSFILKKIEENTHIKGYRSALANAAGCGKSFLSQALNSSVQLTLDHGAGLCAFWNLDDARTDFFLDLMNLERAATLVLKKRIEKRLKTARTESKQLVSRSAQEMNLSAGLKEAIYYSSWHYAAVHTLTAVPGYQKPPAIAQRLDLPTLLVERTLRDLAAIGLVESKGNLWTVKGASIHLPKESPLSSINQTSWRNQAMRHLGVRPYDGIHYSALFALSRADATKLHNHFNEAIAHALKVVEPSHEEELFCLNLDYWSV
ncbi:MAG: DUF4423 domain-containing protein [Oligoflexales bacterium]